MNGTLRICSQIGFNLISRKRNQMKQLPILSSKCANLVTVAKQKPEDGFIKVPPFPYKTKRYTKLHVIFPFLDPTELRMNKNSKIVVVEGNMGSKKEEVAKGLAEAFGFFYLPEPNIDKMFINHDNFDYKTLNKYIHPKLHAIDEKMFYEDPHHPAVPWFKIFYYHLRYMQYIDALMHLFNTGQGVILERSCHSDFVFADAMHKCGFLPKDAYDYYYRLRYDTIHQMKRPHLIIYLDTDTDICMENIKKRAIPYQVNSKVLTKEYLNEIKNSYKIYLEDANKYSELMIFKWDKPVPLDEMILEIEKTNIDQWDIKGNKFRDWNFYSNSIMNESRYMYTIEKIDLVTDLQMTLIYDTDSMLPSTNDIEHRDNVYRTMVPNYGKIPSFIDKNKSFLKKLFTFNSPSDLVEFYLRDPFY